MYYQEKLPERLIFTASSGRSGTKHLSRILGLFNGVASLHEPEPNFSDQMRLAQKDPAIALKFLKERKIPEIQKIRHSYYAEVTSMWCKGLLRAWLSDPELPVPDLIILDRNLRDIALSLFRLQLTPERTHNGREWYIGPTAETAILSVSDWEAWSDYQICYWYALEIEARKVLLGNLVLSKGGRVYRTNIEALSKIFNIRNLAKAMDLPQPSLSQWKQMLWLLRRRTNTQGSEKWDSPFDSGQLLAWEEEVICKCMGADVYGI